MYDSESLAKRSGKALLAPDNSAFALIDFQPLKPNLMPT